MNMQNYTGKVIQVTDGDTLRVQSADGVHVVRLAGVDAPELEQDYGWKARQVLSDLVLERTVAVEPVWC